MNFKPFGFMEWAKAGKRRIDFTRSGLPPVPPEILGVRKLDITLSEVSAYGPKEVCRKLALRHGIPEEEIFLSGGGSSLALFLLGLLFLEPGDLVASELPGYQVFRLFGNLFKAETIPLERKEGGYHIGLEELEKVLERKPRLVVITNLHNPSGAFINNDEMKEIAGMVWETGARLVVDEVFAEFLPKGERPLPAHLAHEKAITISSFTKAFGLGSLRAGWVLADPETVWSLKRLNNFLQVKPPTLPFKVLEMVLEKEESIYEWVLESIERVEKGIQMLQAIPGLSFPRPRSGMTVFAGIEGVEDMDPFCRWLEEKWDISIVPGSFFGKPDKTRIGITPAEDMEENVETLKKAISSYFS